MEILNQIEQLKERIAEIDRDMKIYGDMWDNKRMTRIALREMVDKLEKHMKIYGDMWDNKRMTRIALREMVDKLEKQMNKEYEKA